MRTPTGEDYKYTQTAYVNIGKKLLLLKDLAGLTTEDMANILHIPGSEKSYRPAFSRIIAPSPDRPIRVDTLHYMRKWGVDIDALFDGRTLEEPDHSFFVAYKVRCICIESAKDPQALGQLKEFRSKRFGGLDTQREAKGKGSIKKGKQKRQAIDNEIVALEKRIGNLMWEIMEKNGYNLLDFSGGLANYCDDMSGPEAIKLKEEVYGLRKKANEFRNEADKLEKKLYAEIERFNNMVIRLMKATGPKAKTDASVNEVSVAKLLIILRRVFGVSVNDLLDGESKPTFEFPFDLNRFSQILQIDIANLLGKESCQSPNDLPAGQVHTE